MKKLERIVPIKKENHVLSIIKVILIYFLVPIIGIIPFLINGINIYAYDNIYTEIFMIGLDFTIMMIMFIIFKDDIKTGLNNFKNNIKNNIKIMAKWYVIGFLIMIISNLIINLFITKDIASNEIANRELLLSFPIYTSLALIISAPVIEELVFRANFNKIFKNDCVFSIITGLLFALVHVLNGINGTTDLLYLIPYGGLGVAFGFIYRKTKSIECSIMVHSLHNLITLLVILGEF